MLKRYIDVAMQAGEKSTNLVIHTEEKHNLDRKKQQSTHKRKKPIRVFTAEKVLL